MSCNCKLIDARGNMWLRFCVLGTGEAEIKRKERPGGATNPNLWVETRIRWQRRYKGKSYHRIWRCKTGREIRDTEKGKRLLQSTRRLLLLHVLYQGVQQDERPVRHCDGSGLRGTVVPWLLRVLRGGVLWRIGVIVGTRALCFYCIRRIGDLECT